ncbi:MAG: diaminopimelate decarboxylase [Chloroflexales bacterium]|nr:diaminopimelate decarboxylase [Chloroflexales bacterium]
MSLNHVWPLMATIAANGHLTIAGHDVVDLADQYDTPLYLFDEATIRDMCQAYIRACHACGAGDAIVHYAGKALLTTAIAKLVYNEGLALDVVSGGELALALHAGVPASHIHLHGNAKTSRELDEALAAGIGAIVVDNLDELALVIAKTTRRATPFHIQIRVTPDIAADTHHHIQTGHYASKFGFPLEVLPQVGAMLRAAKGVRLTAIHAHLGSQIFDAHTHVAAVDVLLDQVALLQRQYGIAIEALNIGGGLAVAYVAAQQPPDITQAVAAIWQQVVAGCARHGLSRLRLELEPGRSIVARAGVAVYRVIAGKPVRDLPRWVHVDGGMADNIRPSLYGAKYTALIANRAAAAADEVVNVAGRYCESGDVLLHDTALASPQVGDLVALATAGAYTVSMASNYNLVPRPTVLLLRAGHFQIMRRRETYADMWRLDG